MTTFQDSMTANHQQRMNFEEAVAKEDYMDSLQGALNAQYALMQAQQDYDDAVKWVEKDEADLNVEIRLQHEDPEV